MFLVRLHEEVAALQEEKVKTEVGFQVRVCAETSFSAC